MAEKPIRKTTGKGGNYRKTKAGAGMTKKEFLNWWLSWRWKWIPSGNVKPVQKQTKRRLHDREIFFKP